MELTKPFDARLSEGSCFSGLTVSLCVGFDDPFEWCTVSAGGKLKL